VKEHDARHRPIRSYVLRTGRLTPGQEKAFERYWPLYGVDFTPGKPLNFSALFGDTHPVWMEIGFGNGASLVEMARQFPERNYLGIEVHTPGVGHLLREVAEQKLSNIRVMSHDAIEILKEAIPEQSLAGLQLFFPDPWHKKKHHKRRIVQSAFVELLATRLQPDGIFHAATDWQDYAQHIMSVFSSREDLFRNLAGAGQYSPRPTTRPVTKFEKRGERLGHDSWDLIFQRTSDPGFKSIR